MSDTSKFRLVSEWLGESLVGSFLFEVLGSKVYEVDC
jgi:hypothetical protein